MSKKKKIAVLSMPTKEQIFSDKFKCPVCHLHQIGGRCTCVKPRVMESNVCPNCFKLTLEGTDKDKQITELKAEVAQSKAVLETISQSRVCWNCNNRLRGELRCEQKCNDPYWSKFEKGGDDE